MNKNFVLENVKDFHLKDVLECGQCFHFQRTDSGINPNEYEYDIVFRDRVLHIKEEPDQGGVRLILENTEEWEYQTIWREYFDLDRDYSEIKNKIIKADPRLEEIIEEHNGIRILNQDFFETLISFIISQNKQIPQIKQVVNNLSSELGTKFDVTMINRFGTEFDAFFPTVDQLYSATEDEIRLSKCGFRAPYIVDATKKVKEGEISEDKLLRLDSNEARQLLMTIHGVGEKVANCVLLFGLGRTDVFPVDVWMKRVCEYLYFGEDTPKSEIEHFATEKFGDVAGYAQQYLFIYGQEHKIR
ncbi:MAG: DNA-3-methyladenine glycosylase 2 family protein [Eubacterium sp.]|nr:DNA-3-methyladenine glycosylase 2 family protein [Eubacterium sp.]